LILKEHDSSIEQENISFSKPRKYQLKEIQTVPLLVWENVNTFIISQPPWMSTDGDIFLYKDSTENEKIPIETLLEQGVVPPTQSGFEQSSKHKIPEPSIVIHTRYDKPFPTNKSENTNIFEPKENEKNKKKI